MSAWSGAERRPEGLSFGSAGGNEKYSKYSGLHKMLGDSKTNYEMNSKGDSEGRGSGDCCKRICYSKYFDP